MSSSLAPAAAPALEPATAPLESAAADVEIISPSPYHPRKMLNPGVLQWDTFNFLMRGGPEDGSTELRKILLANVFCGLEALQLTMARNFAERDLLGVGVAARGFAPRTNALGLKKCTEALMTIYEHSLSCYSTVHDYPMPEKEVVKVDDVVMAEVKEEVKEEEAARVERGKFEDQAGESEIKQDDHDDDEDFKEEEDEDEEDEIIVPRGTRSRGRTAATLKYTPKRPIKSIPARSKVPKVSKYPDPPPLAPEVQAPLDLAREAYKKSFMADLADQKGFLLALKAAQSSTELFVHKFFGEKSLEAVDQPSQAQLTRVAEEAKRKVAFETERLKKEREAKQKVKTEAVEPEVKVEGGAL